MTFFFADPPLQLGDDVDSMRVERGLFLTGGVDEDGVLANDMWIYDLTNSPLGVMLDPAVPLQCGWVRVAGDAMPEHGGIAGHGVVWDGPRRRFVSFGGLGKVGGTEFTRDGVYALSVDDWASPAESNGFDALPVILPWLEYPSIRRSAPECVAPELPQAFAPDLIWSPCAVTGYHAVSSCDLDPTVVVPSYDGSVLCEYVTRRPCASDPSCADASSWDAMLEGSVLYAGGPGLAYFATVVDPTPAGEHVRIHGGFTGCDGAFCDDWEELTSHAWSADALHRAANPYTLTFDLASSSFLDPEGLGRPSFVPPAHPELPDHGASRWSATTLGLTWDLSARDWTGSSYGLLVGGTFYQSLPLERRYELVDAHPHVFWDDLEADSGADVADAWWGWMPPDYGGAEETVVAMTAYHGPSGTAESMALAAHDALQWIWAVG